MDLNDAAMGAGGGLLAVLAQWLLGRSDSAAERRKAEIRLVAKEVVDAHAEKLNADIRITKLEIILPRIEGKVDENSELVRSQNELLNRIASQLSGRIHVRESEP